MATLTETAIDTESLNKLWEESETDAPYNLIILDDDVNTMDHVVNVFMIHFKLSEKTAILKMLEVHNMGSSILATGSKEEMETHRKIMTEIYKLRAVVEQIIN